MPSPTTALDLITRAMRKVGVIAFNETPTAEDATEALAVLGDVLERWSIENLAVYGGEAMTFPIIAGKGRYTIGVGADFVTSRPVSIDDLFVSITGVDFPVTEWSQGEYDSVAVKTVQGIPERFLYVNTTPVGVLLLYPVPAIDGSISINAPTVLTQVASLATTISLPPGYAEALIYAVGAAYGDQFGSPIDVSEKARSSLALLKRSNRTSRAMAFDSTLTGGGITVPARGY